MRSPIGAWSLVFVCAATSAGQPALRVRSPLEKSVVRLESPRSYLMRTKVDRSTGQEVEYDPKPEVVVLDEKKGTYGLKWIGYDGAEKTIVYQRPDLLDVVVTARVTVQESGKYRYEYTVQSLSTSVEVMAGFAVQSVAKDPAPLEQSGVFVGTMAPTPPFNQGVWNRFGVLPGHPPIAPGTSIVFQLESRSPPGVVECRVHGPLGLKGVGEEPPFELESVLPRYEIWPHGYTVGPREELAALNEQERADRVIAWLPTFEHAGWITAATGTAYEGLLRERGVAGVAPKLEGDLAKSLISPEVAAIIRELRRPKGGA